MAFILEDTKQLEFDCIGQMIDHVEKEKKNTARISIGELLKEGAKFSQDKSFGKGGGYQFKFNKPALDSLCQLLNLYLPMLKSLDKEGLASDILNDRMHSIENNLNTKLNQTQFVFDEPSQTVLGVVSESYVGYSNQDFIEDVRFCLTKDRQQSLLPSFGEFEFAKSYSINTHLNIRLKSTREKGVVHGSGGTGDDVSVFGLQVSNSMAGGKALRLAYFVERSVCANGLILPVGGASARMIHAGHRENFDKRFYAKMNNVVEYLSSAKKVIENLGGIEFKPEQLSKHLDLKALFSIIPDKDLKKLGSDKFTASFKGSLSSFDKKEREIQKNAEIIRIIPSLIGGEYSQAVFNSSYRENASVFDFINVFTEEAHKYRPEQRLQIEKETGDLADFIAKNKKKFS